MSHIRLTENGAQDRLLMLPRFSHISTEIEATGGIFRTATVQEFEAEFGEIDFSIRPVELFSILPDRDELKYDDTKWTAFILSDDKIPKQCYKALIDLLTGDWKYELAWREYSENISKKGKTKQPRMRRTKLTATLLSKFNQGSMLLNRERKFRIALLRWSGCFTRADPLDSVLDCCSCLEASFQMGDELRLRTSLAVYYSLSVGRKEAFSTVYELYGIRNKFIHGANIPEVSPSQRRRYVELVASLLLQFVKMGKIPDSSTINKQILEQFGASE